MARSESREPQPEMTKRAGGEEMAGVSLVEVVVAMFVLALMSMAVIPLLIASARLSTQNSALTTATSLANAQLAELRAAFRNDGDSSCTAVQEEVADRMAAGISGPAGNGLTGTLTAGSCPAQYPGTVRVSISVASTASAAPLVLLSTELLVAQA